MPSLQAVSSVVLFGAGFGSYALTAIVCALAACVVAILLAVFRPEILMRAVLWVPAHLLYSFRVVGQEHIPAKGGVLFVSNHVSFLDAGLIFLAQRRPVHFMIWAPFTRAPFFGWFFKLTRVIPIDGSAGPRALLRSLHTASEILARGDVVCVFAEGGITRTGFILPFHRGLEQIVKKCPAPIVPVCLDRIWGSIFSFKGGRFLWKWPQQFPYPVTVAFGPPLPASTPAYVVRRAIQKLSADCSIARANERRPVHRQFVRTACRHPKLLCYVDYPSKRKVTFGEALVGSRLLARALRPIVGKDDKVAVWLPPSIGGAMTNVALAFLGKVVVNLNYTSSPDVVRSCLRQCRIRHVLTARAFLHRIPMEVPAGVTLHFIEDLVKGFTRFQKVSSMLLVWLLPRFIMEHWVLGLGKHKAEDLATVIFSSGSTGEPKGVMLTHANVSANIEAIIQAINPTPRDRLFGILPFFHSFGYTVTIWVPLQTGTSTMYFPDPRQGKEIGELIKEFQATLFITTPTLLRFCLKRCDAKDFNSLRLLVTGAEKLPQPLAVEFGERFGIVPLEGYGCTELSPAAALNVPDWDHNGIKQPGNKPGSIGQPLPGMAVRIVCPDTGKELGPEKEGMLLMRGANVMKGYLGRPDATREAIRDGWYVTGDIARFDEDGFITITDRLARFSKIGGEMVPHQKIEDELHVLLGCNERMFTVTALPDERKGERLVVLHTKLSSGWSVESLWKQLNGRGLPSLWVPSQRDFFEVAEMPVLGTGKIDLKKVKEMAVQCAH